MNGYEAYDNEIYQTLHMFQHFEHGTLLIFSFNYDLCFTLLG